MSNGNANTGLTCVVFSQHARRAWLVGWPGPTGPGAVTKARFIGSWAGRVWSLGIRVLRPLIRRRPSLVPRRPSFAYPGRSSLPAVLGPAWGRPSMVPGPTSSKPPGPVSAEPGPQAPELCLSWSIAPAGGPGPGVSSPGVFRHDCRHWMTCPPGWSWFARRCRQLAVRIARGSLTRDIGKGGVSDGPLGRLGGYLSFTGPSRRLCALRYRDAKQAKSLGRKNRCPLWGLTGYIGVRRSA